MMHALSGDSREAGEVRAARTLERLAKKRKAEFPSEEAASERLQQTFEAFDAEALQMYIEHGFKTLSGAAPIPGWFR